MLTLLKWSELTSEGAIRFLSIHFRKARLLCRYCCNLFFFIKGTNRTKYSKHLRLHCNPVQGSTGSLQGNPCNENRMPAMRTGFPWMKTGFFPVRISSQGKSCFQVPNYARSFASADFTGAVFTHGEFQKSPEIFASLAFYVLIP